MNGNLIDNPQLTHSSSSGTHHQLIFLLSVKKFVEKKSSFFHYRFGIYGQMKLHNWTNMIAVRVVRVYTEYTHRCRRRRRRFQSVCTTDTWQLAQEEANWIFIQQQQHRRKCGTKISMQCESDDVIDENWNHHHWFCLVMVVIPARDYERQSVVVVVVFVPWEIFLY